MIIEAGVGHACKEHFLNIAVFTEMSKESSWRSVISMRLRNLDWQGFNILLGFTARIKTGLSFILGSQDIAVGIGRTSVP